MISSKEFEEKYKKLNAEQKKAVDTIDGPVLVVAGPGTGKTTILTLRIAQILRKTDTPAHGILAITYTDAGVKAMREKLREVIGSEAHDVYIHTFHGFASAMMAEYPDHFIRIGDFKQMTDVEQESIVRSILTDQRFTSLRPLSRPDAYISSIIKAISDSKKEALTPSMVREYVKAETKKTKNDESNISTRGITKGKLKAEALEKLEKLDKTFLFADLYEKYEEEKNSAKLRDYDDLIIEFLVALRTDQLLLRLVQERFLYILVDEHQDTNDAQNYIISLIAEFFETPNIFIVGDEKQAIYRFQGASVDNFLSLQKRWPSMEVIALNTNYRSHQGILDASFAMIENNYDEGQYVDLRVQLKPGSDLKKRPLDIVIGENTSATEKYLVDELRKISKDEPKATVAVITRRNRELERVLRVLESHGISVSSERSLDIFHHPIGMAFFDLIEYVVDPSKIDALSKTLAIGMWGLNFGKAVEIIRLLRSGQVSELDKQIPAILNIKKRMLDSGAVGGIIHCGEESGFTALVSRDPSFVHVWRAIITLAESLARDGDIDNPTELMKIMLAHRQSAESKTVKVSVGAPDFPIKAMTAHGSKGLEFDYIFMPYTSEETWVGRSHGSSFILPEKNLRDHDVRDIRRLFYVAITRARKHAVILSSLEESDGKTLTPLRFVDELHKDNVVTVSLPRSDISLENAKGKTINSEYNDLMISEAKRVLLENGLSVTALNHFLECPSKFMYESILKLPQAPSVSAEKGSSMHDALSEVWREQEHSPKKIEKIIATRITEYIDKSLLSPGDKEALKKELIENTPAVAVALTEHFNTKGIVSTERWIKFPFDGVYKKEKVTIPVHGKLDVIIDTGDETAVFDYKTRQKMSVEAIKGETKNDDGNYFRQLIFYKLLLQNNREWRTKKISTSLVFVSPDDKGRCPTITLPVEEDDVKRVKQEIQSVIESVWSGKITTEYCSDRECKYCGYRKLLQ
ncbi:MAG: ATP-dependent DNA helicase [Candidatus Paceibacterota bacterium]|jgi:DNA helicase-2/ATP-dependent DNA helicase PcrA